MKVGDYVRYKKLIYHNQGVDDIRISKIKDIEDAIETGYNQKFIFFENGNGEYEDRIIKSSPNIIDLLEKSDLVVDYTGDVYKVDFIYDGYVFTTFIGEDGITKTLTNYQIKSIVTKEQFESMEYKVGD